MASRSAFQSASAARSNTHSMAHILLLANETHGIQLKSDLESIGHNVSHQTWNQDRNERLYAGNQPIDPVDLLIVDDDEFSGQLSESVQYLLRPPMGRNTPILLITDEARVSNLDFSTGITDFITRPHSLGQLDARLKLILGRTERRVVIQLDELVINLVRYEVRICGTLVDLTLKEYELLKYLVVHRDRVFTRSDLLDRIWGYDYHGGMRTVDVHVARLRSKLAGFNGTISTVRGVGYGFEWPST